MYVADYQGNNVLKIPSGGGSATVVSLGVFTTNEIAGVALDGAGNLFITDHFNSRIVEVTAGAVASVLNITGLSTGLSIPTGLTVDAANNLYISDYGNSRIVKVTPSGAGSVVATPGFTPGVVSVLGVAVDAAGTVYFPDAQNNRVIKVTAAGAASLVVPAGLTPVLSSPQGVAVDGFGNLYIADAGNDRLVEVTSAGVASVVPTPGLTSPSTLGTFYAIAADASGNILVPDFSSNRIVEVNLSGATLAFPNTQVGSTSSPQTATVTNIGDLPLVFATHPAYTANFPENTGDTNLCTSSTSLAAGELCDVSAEFTPQSVGSLSAGITVTNNNLNGSNATENVAVSGTGTLAATATALAAGPNPAIAGQSVLLTASVSPEPAGSPLGTLSFYNGATLLGSGTLNSSGVATLATTSLPVGADSLTAVYSGNAGFSGSTSSVFTETVTAPTAVTTSTALTVSPNPVFDGQPATLTATVSPAPTGSPAGTVSFYSGATLLGTGTLNASGVATFTTSSLAVGAEGITAVYAGNAGFAASTSSALSLTVTTSFAVTAPTTAIPVAPGGAATVDITVPPLGGAFNSVVTLSASGLPAGATATFNPPKVTPGSAGAPTVMTIQLATLAAGIPANHRGLPAAEFGLAFAVFGTVFGAALGCKRRSRRLMPLLILAGVTASLITSCGGGFGNTPQTRAGNYTITVTGTSGSFQASTTVTLVVQ
jgi:sugar lactone lactonase YvrE